MISRSEIHTQNITLRRHAQPCGSVHKKCVALAEWMTIIIVNNTPDASHKNCAPSEVTNIRKTPPTHLVSSAHQGGSCLGGRAL